MNAAELRLFWYEIFMLSLFEILKYDTAVMA